MSGSNSMIRAALILLLLSSCGNLPITYIQNFSSVNSVVFGFPDQEITQELYDEYEYSFIKVRFGRGPISIMILAYVDDGVYQWSGVDDVTLYTLNGRVIKTTGLQTDFEIPDPKPRSHGEAGTIYESINLFSPNLYHATLKTSLSQSPKSIVRFGSRVDAVRAHEKASIPIINWKQSNYYFRSLGSDLVEKTEQHIHPRLPVLHIEFYYKF
ncbi:MAG TPA: hypothetical protein DHV86_01850 [Methylophilaceae bacterium]|jgi:hypothetical protein|nr:hypothetical protein [Methylophilaceae bacterium]